MKASEDAKLHGQYADQYDDLTEQFEAHTAEIMFGLMFDYVRRGEKLLALGIGTGLCAGPFRNFGLQISGADISDEMMDHCRKKGITQDLEILDLRYDKFPWDNESFDHVMANGIYHFVEDLNLSFQESCRVLKPGGMYGFTTMDPGNIDKDYNTVSSDESEIVIFEHSHKLILELLDRHGFTLKKRARVLLYKTLEKTEELICGMYVAVKST